MIITSEEHLMYQVMKAIFESGIPISFKGSMVLKAFLMDAGFSEETRHTVDIDGNWNSDSLPSAEQMVESLQEAVRRAGILLDVSIYRMYGEGRSAGFEMRDPGSDEVLFSMDIDVNRPLPQTRMYEIAGIHFRGVTPVQIIADKISAISSDKVFRRIKDVIDLYYISRVFDFNKDEVLLRLKESDRWLENFRSFLHRRDDLEHSYEKFRFSGEVEKPSFDDVYGSVKNYIKDVLPKEKDMETE